MNQIKIGKFIAERRKKLGYTQCQLGEMLGLTGKSVSKWERGVCLPEVSIYQELCSILGISLNEFFAGEEIEADKLAEKSEENIMGIAKYSKVKRTKLTRIIAILSFAAVLLVAITAGALYFINKEGYFLHNYIKPYSMNEDESYVTELVTHSDENAHLFKFSADSRFTKISFFKTVYLNGEKKSREEAMSIPLEKSEENSGAICIITNRGNDYIIKAAMGGTTSSISASMELPVETGEGYGFSYSSMSDINHIDPGTDIGLLAFYADSDGMKIVPVSDIHGENIEDMAEDQCCVLFSCVFE